MMTPTSPGALVCERSLLPRDLPSDLLDCLPDGCATSVYFAHPASEIEIVGEGVAAEIRADGPDRFAHAAASARALFGELALSGSGPAPLLVGGFGFADDRPTDPRWEGMPALRFVLPERLWIRTGGETWLVRTRVSEPARADEFRAPPGDDVAAGRARRPLAGSGAASSARVAWIDGVRGAIAAIASGPLRKIVLARSCESATTATARSTVRRLRDGRAECVSFWVQHGGASFVGSSPEVLARVTDGAIEATALAGSAPRGRRAANDEARARQLLVCPKNRGEHAFVADDVRRALGSVCDEVDERPIEVRSYPEAFHLATPFRGTLLAGLGLLDAARALHPTSAVCGAPREEARSMIAAVEPERGWYAGGVGWMDASGQGTLAVALRCGLFRRGAVTLWAGAGIVHDSDPATEYDETEIKMQAMRRALAEPEPSENAAHAV